MAQDVDVNLQRGRLRARRYVGEGVPAICIPGLSSNSRAFLTLGERFDRENRALIAFDLRGRGHSDITEKGTYGWENHARDIFDAAEAIDIDRFDLVGHSMGAFVALAALSLDRSHRIRRLVLIDAAGLPSKSALEAIVAAMQRLNRRFETADDYVNAIRDGGMVVPWNDMWEQHYRYDLVEDQNGVHSRTSYEAIAEDSAYGVAHDPRELWPVVSVPALLLRANVPFSHAPDAFVLPKSEYDAFLRAVPSATGAEIQANHYGIVCDAQACERIAGFLS